MVEGSESGGLEQGPGFKPASSIESVSGRLRFTVELQPGETTVVSWQKLLRDANLSNSNWLKSSSGVSSEAQRIFVSQPLPASGKQTMENEPKDSQARAGSNRLHTVIERIEITHEGNGRSNEKDLALDNMPDDDEYGGEDSIDDTGSVSRRTRTATSLLRGNPNVRDVQNDRFF